jgi:hypothetical protein
MSCNSEFFLQDLPVSSIGLVRGLHIGSSRLRLPAPKDQSFQGGQSYLPVHNTSWLRYHVSRGTINTTRKSVHLNYKVTDQFGSVPFIAVPQCYKIL